MSKVLVEESSLHGVGNGIRYVNGQNTTYKPAQFEAAIKSLKPVMGTKRITANGTFPASGDNLDGFSAVTVAVPPRSAVLVEKSVTANGEYDAADDDADGYSAVTVEVPNTYEAGDEGKVVSEGELVSQTSVTKNANGTYDTTLNNQVVVAVPNSYAAGDEGKVVSNGALVSQGSQTVTENGTYDTTLKNSVTVNVSGSAPAVLETLNVTENGTFTPGTGVDGFDEVNVNVVGSSDGELPGEYMHVAYGAGVFVAAGYGVKGAVSANGAGWYEVTMLPSYTPSVFSNFEGIAYGNGVFVAVGSFTNDVTEKGIIVYSSDGINWHWLQSGKLDRYPTGIVFGGGKFVIFLPGTGNDKKVMVSTDGETWTESSVSCPGFTEPFITYGNNKFLGLYGYTVWTSSDGTSWSSASGPAGLDGMCVCFGGGKFVALPFDSADDVGYYSSDGATWTQVSLPVTEAWSFISYGGGRFLAVSESNVAYALISDDGITWRTLNGPAGQWNEAAYGDGTFVAVDWIGQESARFGLNLTALTVTQNGTYTPPSGADGFSQVTVNVPAVAASIEEWDFTQSLTGSKHGTAATLSGAVQSSAGITFASASDSITVPIRIPAMTIEIDVASMQLTSGTNRRFLMATGSNGFIYRSTGKWAFYNGSWEDSALTNGSLFDGCTVKIEVDADGCWSIYKDNVFLWKSTRMQKFTSTTFSVGSSTTGINNAVITGLRIY